MTKEKTLINLTGDRQAETIQECFRLKEEAKRAEAAYKEARENALPIIFKKVVAFWKKSGTPSFGGYLLGLPDGTQREIAVQDQSSRKTFTAPEAKAIIEGIGCKGNDVLDVVTVTDINSDLLKNKTDKETVLKTLQELETKLKADGKLNPEDKLVKTRTEFRIVEHAVPRILAKSTEINVDVEEALQLLKDPVTCLIKE